ncbi:MAG: SdrD B-like domain-containing protein, partial [Kiritimatiellia bacterium]
TTTSGGGFYNFNNLQPGQYIVYIPTPPASAPRSSDLTDVNDNQQDSDDNGTQAATGDPVSSPVITLASDLEPGGDGDGTDGDLTVDFGFYQPVNLGNLVWNDLNNNGVVDPGEPGIPGVTVELYHGGDTPGVNPPVATQSTGAGGLYNFSDLPPGDYLVSIPTPPVNAPKSSTTTDPADNGQDNDDNGAQPGGTGTRTTSPVVTLLSPTEPDVGVDGDGAAGDLTVDFGFFQPVNLGNLVWHDQDGDGFKDAAEPGIPDVTVELYLSTQTPGTDSPVATDVTDPNGLYNFDDLSPGQYLVYIPVAPPATPASSPAGVTDTADNGQDLDDNGSQPGGTGAPVTSPVITLLAGTEPVAGEDGDGVSGDLTVDFGFYTPVRVGDLVWNDLDGDGVQDSGEPGVTNVVVTLVNNTTSAVVSNLTTGVNGEYLFTDLPPGDYFVTFELPPGYLYTVPDSTNATDSTDSDAGVYQTGGVASTPPTGFLFSGQEDITLDAGAYEPATLGDTVWIDVTRDGDPSNENLAALGIPGVTVDLLRILEGATNIVGTTTTSTNLTNRGYYVFTNLPPGSYVVRVDTNTVPAGYPEPTTVTEYLTVLASGDDSEVEDFGFITETTAIDLKSLAAAEVPGGVRVAWETSSEKDNFGFLVYRSDRLNGTRTLVSPALIEGQGTGSGSSYAFLDAGVDPGRYFYWLEDLDYDGTRTIHGPAVVVVDGTSSAAASAGLVPVFVAGAANVAVEGVTVPSAEVEGGLVVVTTAGAGVTAAEGEPVRLTVAEAAPVEGAAVAATLAEGNVAVVSAKAGTNLLVGGFTSAPVAVLVSAEGGIVLEAHGAGD